MLLLIYALYATISYYAVLQIKNANLNPTSVVCIKVLQSLETRIKILNFLEVNLVEVVTAFAFWNVGTTRKDKLFEKRFPYLLTAPIQV